MKIEYIEVLMSYIAMIVVMTILFLVIDLFIDNTFVIGMIVFLSWVTPLHVIGLIIEAFRTNYKIIKRD